MSPPVDTGGAPPAPRTETLADAFGRLAADLQQQPVPVMAERVRAAAGQAVPPPPLTPRTPATTVTPRTPIAPMAPARRSLRWRWAAWGFSGAALCALALVGSVLLVLLAPQDPLPAAGAQARAGSGFVTVASVERWEQLLRDDAVASAWLVSTEMPRERLAALGLPFDPSRAGDRVSAELLMDPSGEVLAVRVLSR